MDAVDDMLAKMCAQPQQMWHKTVYKRRWHFASNKIKQILYIEWIKKKNI